ncbi:hypothetical protein BGAL_0701g00010 [Botrytis galanthina]|uniref:Uncharacterized protein n=1 Tax=Botrytis galanthina TaxID=278940 RepID=A0A4S8QMA1_9HELO|nr:hypothetical protein BGAL_0701g00010 [Botrytis galanthina]
MSRADSDKYSIEFSRLEFKGKYHSRHITKMLEQTQFSTPLTPIQNIKKLCLGSDDSFGLGVNSWNLDSASYNNAFGV